MISVYEKQFVTSRWFSPELYYATWNLLGNELWTNQVIYFSI